ncbi:MAG: hypothetical protein JXL97_20460 [Bacteroidales bacterium]|nr:hypothetical protein [Bacteroidales bacterium]
MNEAYELLQKINWFLKPVSKFIIFLFTTKLGLTLLLVFFVLVVLLMIYNKLIDRRLVYRAATNENKIPFKDFVIIILEELSKIITKVVSNITVLVVVLFLMLAIVGLSATFSTVDNFIANQNKIKEMKLVVKNLNQRYKVAKVEILDYDWQTDSTKMKISFFDYAQNGYLPDVQEIALAGHNIYFLTFVLNFDYSLIESGQEKNIAIPYLIFTEKMTQEQGIKLNVKDSSGMPFVFNRQADDLYGISVDTYNERMKEILLFMNDEDKAREAGIRSFYSTAPNFVKALRKGQTFIIWIEQTGGLVIKQEEDW